jgi:hypothetical protein
MVKAAGTVRRRGATEGETGAERRGLAGRTVSGLHPPGYGAPRAR